MHHQPKNIILFAIISNQQRTSSLWNATKGLLWSIYKSDIFFQTHFFLYTECWLPPEEHHLVCDQQQPLPAHPPNHPVLQLASSTQEHHLCFQRYNVHHQPKNIILSAITSNPLLTIGIIQRRTSLLFLTPQCAWSTEEHHITKPHTPHPLLTIGIIQPRTLSLFSISQLTSSSKEHHLCLMQQGGFCGTLTIPTSSRWVCVWVLSGKSSHHWLSTGPTGPTGLTGPTSLTVPTRSTHCTSERIYHGTSEAHAQTPNHLEDSESYTSMDKKNSNYIVRSDFFKRKTFPKSQRRWHFFHLQWSPLIVVGLFRPVPLGRKSFGWQKMRKCLWFLLVFVNILLLSDVKNHVKSCTRWKKHPAFRSWKHLSEFDLSSKIK